MQLDFHYATTYVLARWADFSHEDAETIAHACQFTDDANSRGFVKFSNGVMCSQIPTSIRRVITTISRIYRSIRYGFLFIFCLEMQE